MCDVYVTHKNGKTYPFNEEQLFAKVNYSANRVLKNFNSKERLLISDDLKKLIQATCEPNEEGNIVVASAKMHDFVEVILERWFPEVAKSYRYYRNYHEADKQMWNKLFEKGQEISLRGNKDNANVDSSLVSCKRFLFSGEVSKELYGRYFLFQDEREAFEEGYIYIHDASARRDTFNCCLFDIRNVLSQGFYMSNMWYSEPKSLLTAFEVIGDIILSAAGQQYGGFTIPELDSILVPYAEKTYRRKYEEVYGICVDMESELPVVSEETIKKAQKKAEESALKQVQKEFEQGFQGWEYKFNTVASSRGDYPFITVTTGLEHTKFGIMCNKAMFKVRKNGHGKPGYEKPVLFPKIVFLYDEDLHGPGKELEEVFNAGIDCSLSTMYPDWLSLTGEGYVPSVYKEYGKVISPMGCRAFLSPWFVKGGLAPADDGDEPVFVGRANIGVISLNLPMILQKSRVEGKDFYEVLDYYLGICKRIHERTYEYLGHMKASCDPLGFCEGGFFGGNLDMDDEIAPVIKSWTASIGVTAGEEFQHLYNGKSLREDGDFFEEVLIYLKQKVTVEWKKETGHLYALYGTPAESLAGKQVKQFRQKYGVIKGVSDREYVSNSFHCHVTEDITQLQKQDAERRYWDYLNGGKIQYVKYPISYNREAAVTLVRRAMRYGFYEGVNLDLSYCNNCGHASVELGNADFCPCCSGNDITKINRMNGYLGITRLHSSEKDGRFNEAKAKEISERVSM